MIATNNPNVAVAEDIRDIKPPFEISDGLAWLWWTLAILAAVIGAFLLWRWWKKKKSIVPIMPQIPAHERARRKLEAALELFEKPKPFCIIVSDAVRLYLEERFGLRAPERTTEEFLADLSRSAALNYSQKGSMKVFLSACDMVKFAKHEPQRLELEALYNSALRLIEETEPKELQNSESRSQESTVK